MLTLSAIGGGICLLWLVAREDFVASARCAVKWESEQQRIPPIARRRIIAAKEMSVVLGTDVAWFGSRARRDCGSCENGSAMCQYCSVLSLGSFAKHSTRHLVGSLAAGAGPPTAACHPELGTADGSPGTRENASTKPPNKS